MTEDVKAFYEAANVAEIEGYIDAAEEDNLHIIKLTKDERFIHQKAAESYEDALKKQTEITEARTLLASYREKAKVLTAQAVFNETLVAANKKEKEKGEESLLTVTFTGGK